MWYRTQCENICEILCLLEILSHKRCSYSLILYLVTVHFARTDAADVGDATSVAGETHGCEKKSVEEWCETQAEMENVFRNELAELKKQYLHIYYMLVSVMILTRHRNLQVHHCRDSHV